MQTIDAFIQAILTALVRLYRWTLSPYLGRYCRFDPTCSAYALEALRCHGGVKGGFLSLKRLCRCHPWGGFGFDPVPPCGKQEPIRTSSESTSEKP